MKKILSKIIVAIIAISLVLGVVSCGGGNSEPVLKIIDIKLTDEQYAFVCKKGNTELVESMNSFMAEIK